MKNGLYDTMPLLSILPNAILARHCLQISRDFPRWSWQKVTGSSQLFFVFCPLSLDRTMTAGEGLASGCSNVAGNVVTLFPEHPASDVIVLPGDIPLFG